MLRYGRAGVAEAEAEDVAVAATWEVEDSAVAMGGHMGGGGFGGGWRGGGVVEGTPEECILEVESTSVEG